MLALLLIHGVASLPDAAAASSMGRASHKLLQHSIMSAGVDGMRKLAQAVAAPAAAPAAPAVAPAVLPCPADTPDLDDM
jgi:hypothetical protein